MADEHADIRQHITGAVENYLSLIGHGNAGRRPSLAALARALDELVMVYHASPDVAPGMMEVEAERVGERALRDGAAAAFPELGFYPLADPLGELDQRVGLGDARDDLAEIAVDLLEVVWLFEHASPEDAIWLFRWGYENHWGGHLHELRLYLHSMAACQGAPVSPAPQASETR
jgi:Domain of unknown function (DUF5063)